MVKVKPGAKVITIGPAQDAYGNISIVKAGGKVITIEPSADALSVEGVYELFSMTFEQVCALKEVQRLGINSFVQAIRGSFVQQIEPAKDAMRMEEVVKLLFSLLAQLLLSLMVFGMTARKTAFGAITMTLKLMTTGQAMAMRNR